ncbi:5-formyltetrahydrofolate cyclo-ligase [Metamycoplasma auris]|uniref:5-formyltetrahydrofolate cyclo-ligase n=1 Tax=Metamycoplasma auris TaxID=51363 RepID=A0A2W7I295_9BACT|nr:5-formyltetrahydrofolate cyclo-ligase [Metamycoplasma auris]PZW01556.1 5-formyltetrahydrofolate cyclo-ligase [Metamycoplasma auris]
MINKNEARTKKLLERKKLSSDYFIKSNIAISRKVIYLIKKKKFKNIGIYLSTKFEVQTNEIIKWCFLNNINVFVPKVLDKRNMEMVLITKDSKYVANTFKINEPFAFKSANLNDIECIFCPLVAFDDNLNRLGMGGGFYDSFFNSHQQNYLKIGIAFDKQKLDDILEIEDHDCKLDLIITEKKIYQ